ncbi:MAG TPA: hypothetical protein VFH73_05210, partial [Polyangia bacterium]|nr:hypothetical protein [Polyangia bacterium]
MPISPQIVHRASGIALLLAAAACGGGGVTPGPSPRALVLEPTPETIWVRPGDHSPVRFRVRTTEGAPVPMVKVSFVIVDEAAGGEVGSQSQGATLSAATAVTDGQGLAEIDVTAGQRTVFRIRGSLDDLEAEAVIVVAAGQVGSVEVAPFLETGSAAAGDVTKVEILFFDNLLCRDFSFGRPPAPARNVRQVAAHDGAAQYDFVSTNVSHAILGRGRDGRGGILAVGCV